MACDGSTQSAAAINLRALPIEGLSGRRCRSVPASLPSSGLFHGLERQVHLIGFYGCEVAPQDLRPSRALRPVEYDFRCEGRCQSNRHRYDVLLLWCAPLRPRFKDVVLHLLRLRSLDRIDNSLVLRGQSSLFRYCVRDGAPVRSRSVLSLMSDLNPLAKSSP